MKKKLESCHVIQHYWEDNKLLVLKKSLIKTTQNTKPKQTRKALFLFCKLISPEETREYKSEQRRCYSFIADPEQSGKTDRRAAGSPDCSEYCISVANGEGKMRPSSYMKTGFQIPTHCFHTVEWLLVSKIWDPGKLCLLAELLPFFPKAKLKFSTWK